MVANITIPDRKWNHIESQCACLLLRYNQERNANIYVNLYCTDNPLSTTKTGDIIAFISFW